MKRARSPSPRRSAPARAAPPTRGAPKASSKPPLKAALKTPPLSGASRWYQDAVIYELRVRSFYDGNGDGLGDFKGLTAKLDYLQDLGVTALWLLPFYPSPLRDDGYDIADYLTIDPQCGTLGDFKEFLAEAHRRGLKVITELVLNHTSDQHPWFQRARKAKPGTPWRDWYVWSDSSEKYKDARVIFQDFEPSNWTWDPLAQSFYWHRFFHHQPDLNFDNPEVRKAMFEALDFWLGLGVDGLRLDAVPYLFERDGTNCENLPETHAFLRELRRHVDARFKDRMLLGEANQWPEDAVAYFGRGDECQMNFHFPIMPRLFMALHTEERHPIVDILEQTPAIPEGCQWALFLRNHDELTLEMVTDEERDYMRRMYAADPQARINLGIRRRLAPLLSNNRRRIELMTSLLCSLPGTPVLYYGDEIGMGDNVYLSDRNGVRTPMQWSGEPNAGFSTVNPQRLYLPVITDPEYHYQVVNVQAQQANPQSLLAWMKRLLALRARYSAFGRGTLRMLAPANPKVLAYLRVHGEQTILVVANLSRFGQPVELDLAPWAGSVPVEMFGRNEFPAIGAKPYALTLGPHSFFWFQLQTQERPRKAALSAPEAQSLPWLPVPERWEAIFHPEHLPRLEEALAGFLAEQRWYSGRGRKLSSSRVVDALSLPGSSPGFLLLVRVEFRDDLPHLYLLPVGFASGARMNALMRSVRRQAIVGLSVTRAAGNVSGVLFDAMQEPEYCSRLLELILTSKPLKGGHGSGSAQSLLPADHHLPKSGLSPHPGGIDQSNSLVVYGQSLVLKLFRRLHAGVNPELEIGQHLRAMKFPHCPPLAGMMDYRMQDGSACTLAMLQGFVPSRGDGWHYTLEELERLLDRTRRRRGSSSAVPVPRGHLLALAGQPVPALAVELIGPYLGSARLLGQRTAQLHTALGTPGDDSEFKPEPFSMLWQRSLYQAMRTLTRRVLRAMGERLPTLPPPLKVPAQRLVQREAEILTRFQLLAKVKIEASRIRCHGDYHLGQVLYTGQDFILLDFEGEPATPLSERRIKRSPLKDVAGMLRSFGYAAQAMRERAPRAAQGAASRWLEFWERWVCVAFLQSYFQGISGAGLLPKDARQLQILLDSYLLEKALYEVDYEMRHRPDWLAIPVAGVSRLLDGAGR